MARQKIVAGNWKMNLTVKQGVSLVDDIIKLPFDARVSCILGVPFTHLSECMAHGRFSNNVSFAAQNCHQNDGGAFTGEISSLMLKEMGVEFVVLGHSERRAYFNESNALLKEKLDKALTNGLKVIFCCGESLKTRKAKKHVSYVTNQLKESLFHLKPKDWDNIILAYEPIWAIGTGETASPQQAQSMHLSIRNFIKKKYKSKASEISILYGGSVKPANAKDLFKQKDIDGALVGGASLKADSFVQIMNSYK